MKTILIITLLLLGISYAYGQNIDTMEKVVQIQNATIVEYVTFSAKEGISKQEMLESAKSTDRILESIAGFKHRFIALQDNNTWVEVVFWESKAYAEKGLESFLEHPDAKDFLDKIKEGSVKIEYSTIL